ncbi:MAG: 1-acyl-sn-glycerol-3-phosphate acyltransferase, partial [Gemmatimonadetes bacterium]|nr:1-acyl-sn-glycerol-3-phosphate acyltransferase [Gemmatimonadota bacterium]
LGYWADGELFVTGREKDLIIRGGRNLTPQEAEEVAGAVKDVRKGCVAAFGVYDPSIGTEQFVIVAETRVADATRRDQLHGEILARVTDALGVPPDRVVIAQPGAVLKTPSGKIRRAAIRDAYQRGALLAPPRPVAVQWIRLLLEGARGRAGRTADLLGRLALTAYAAGLLLATVPPLWCLLRLVPPGRAANNLVKRWSQLALRLSGLPLRVTGGEHLEQAGAAVFVANHASYIDPLVLSAVLPSEFRFIAKHALTSYPVIGTVIRRAQHLTIDTADLSRRLAGADELTRTLRGGMSLAVFPEGGFFRPPGVRPFRLGAFRATVDAGRPVVPIALHGTRRVLPSDTVLLRRSPIEVTIGAPLVPGAGGWPEMVRLRDWARAAIARGAGEPLVETA